MLLNSISHPYQQYLVISWYFLFSSFGFQDSPHFPSTSQLLLSNLLCWFFLTSLTCVHWGPQGSDQELFFISLTALLLSFGPTPLNTICVLTTPRSLAGLLTPDSYIQLYVSISTWMSQTLYIQKRILIFLCIHFLPTAPSTVFQIKYSGVIPDCSFSHTSHLICQQILLVPPSKHTKNLSMSHDCHN